MTNTRALVIFTYLLTFNRKCPMNQEMASKTDLYKAAGFATILVILSIPAAAIGMQLLNLILGNIKV